MPFDPDTAQPVDQPVPFDPTSATLAADKPKGFLARAGEEYARVQGPYKSPLAYLSEKIKQHAGDWRQITADFEAAKRNGTPLLEASPTLNREAQSAALGFLGADVAGEGVNALRAARVRPAPSTPAQVANAAGYVLPPAMAADKPGLVANALSAFGGKIKTQQAASAKNQFVTNSLAAKDLGLPEGTVLTEKAFEKARAPALQATKAVQNANVPIHQDMQFLDDLLRLGPQSEEMAKYFPDTAKNGLIKELQDEFGTGQTFTPKAGIQAIRRLRFKASKNLKDFSDPEKVELGMAQRGAAEAVENLIDRNLSAHGQSDLLDAYRAARQLLAKSYDVEAATNTATGDVNARVLARLADKGRPLTGGLKTIANTAAAFPKAMQPVSQFGGNEPWSALDAAMTAGSLIAGRPEAALSWLGRPLAREMALSRLVQNALARPKPLPPQNSLLSILRPVERPAQPMVPTYAVQP